MKNRINIFLLTGIALIASGCQSAYDDSALTGRLAALDARIQALSGELDRMNGNVAALGGLSAAYMAGSTITAVEELYDEEGILTGYKISFTKGDPVIIHNGRDGRNGHIGTDGVPGTDGTPGHSPVVGIKMVDGVLYWTVDGEILLDGQGNPCLASPDPSSALAKDGETPVVSVEGGNWVVTVGGESRILGPVSDSEVLIVDGVFAAVDVSGNPVVFTLSGGETLAISKAVPFSIGLQKGSGDYVLDWTVEGNCSAVSVDVITDGSWTAVVSSLSDHTGTITLSPPATYRDASFMVLAGDGVSSGACSFSIISGTIVL